MDDFLKLIETLPRLSAETVRQYCAKQRPVWTKRKFYTVYNRSSKNTSEARNKHLTNILMLEAKIAQEDKRKQQELLEETTGAINMVKELRQ